MPTDVILARVVHIVAVVIWIGGVAMVTTVILPAIRRRQVGNGRMAAFLAIERRFSKQARIAVILVGLSGVYMTWRLNLWGRFAEPRFWWMHAMVCVWALFAVILFVGEPLIARRRRSGSAQPTPEAVIGRLQTLHWVLLCLALATVAAATAGTQGWPPI